jgi:hypothetical protein
MIYFKDWLRHDEVYSHDVVISGPFRFYHVALATGAIDV